MGTLATVMVVGGILLWLLGTLLILGAAWNEGCLWTLGVIFVPLVALIFVISHWQQAKAGFLIRIVGIVMVIAGAIIAGPPSSSGHSAGHAAVYQGPIPWSAARQAADVYCAYVRSDRWDDAYRMLPPEIRDRVSNADHAAWWRKQGNYLGAHMIAGGTTGSVDNPEMMMQFGTRAVMLVASGSPKDPSIAPVALAGK